MPAAWGPLGGPTTRWSPVHSRFAADLLTECGSALTSITRYLDMHIEIEADCQRRRQRDPGARSIWTDDVEHQHTVHAYIDKSALLAAAAYSYWVADQIVAESAALERDLKGFVSQFTLDNEDALLMQHPDNTFGFAATMTGVQAVDPPPFPAPITTARSLARSQHTRLDSVRDMLTEAAAAVAHTDTMQSLREHITALIQWCPPPSLPPPPLAPPEPTAVLASCRQSLLRISDGVDAGTADKARLVSGADYTQWLLDELHSGVGSRPCPGEPEPLNRDYDGLQDVCQSLRPILSAAPSIRALIVWVTRPSISAQDRW